MRVPLLDLERTIPAPGGADPAGVRRNHRDAEFHPRAEGGGIRARARGILRRPARGRRFFGNGRAPRDPDGARDRPRRRRGHDGLHIFCDRRLHRARRRDADLRRYRSGDLQHLAGGNLRFSGTVLPAKCAKDLVDRSGGVVRAIVPVHLFGLCCEMDAINALAQRTSSR